MKTNSPRGHSNPMTTSLTLSALTPRSCHTHSWAHRLERVAGGIGIQHNARDGKLKVAVDNVGGRGRVPVGGLEIVAGNAHLADLTEVSGTLGWRIYHNACVENENRFLSNQYKRQIDLKQSKPKQTMGEPWRR
jgi:hypothetical protein